VLLCPLQKVIAHYELLLARQTPPELGSTHFWDELFLLKVNVAYLESALATMSDEEILGIKVSGRNRIAWRRAANATRLSRSAQRGLCWRQLPPAQTRRRLLPNLHHHKRLFPLDWILTQPNLGLIFKKCIQVAENEKGLRLKHALEVTPDPASLIATDFHSKPMQISL
jgi:ribosomal protein L28